MINTSDILETIKMVDDQNLDVRTITLSLSLLDCADSDAKKVEKRVYDKIMRRAGNLVAVGEKLSSELGIPIVNKRVSVTPVSIVGAASGNYLGLARVLDKAAREIGIDFIGGYGALVHKDMTEAEKVFLGTIPEAIASTEKLCSSVNVASTRSGINMDAVGLMGRIVKELAERTKDRDAIGCVKFVVFANAVEDNPFVAGTFTGLGEGEATINVGVSGPGVVAAALKKCKGADLTTVADVIKKTAFKITRAGQLVGEKAAALLGAKFGIVDLSLAPTPAIGDSVAEILEIMGLSSVGGHGTTAALALLNDAVKKGGVMASGMVGGLSGAFIPVSEDAGMIKAVRSGKLSISKLEAMTAVCSVGLDMIAVPGNTSAETISAIIADECAIGVVNNKTTAVRIIPVPGKDVGDEVSFGGLLGSAPIIPVSDVDSSEFVRRGGIIPAPLHSLKN